MSVPDLQVFIRADDQVAYGKRDPHDWRRSRAAGVENVGMVTQAPHPPTSNPNRKSIRVAKQPHSETDRPGRFGYVTAIVVSALGHAAVLGFAFFRDAQTAPFGKLFAEPAYTVKIVGQHSGGRSRKPT